MRSQKRRDTGCEMAVRRILHADGVRYRVDFRPLADQKFRVDIGWKSRKVAVFIDGCFWHACPEHLSIPKRNTEWWEAKLKANSDRDARTNSILRARGWTVLRFWEHEPPAGVADVIRTHLRRSAVSDVCQS
ncbi:very short patch repair endonuclease [Dietzia maris]|uniref:very short patch repair endonuclease n=1 Tax=Dietzia maris TaxID=37915 RepID=UPI0030F54CFF